MKGLTRYRVNVNRNLLVDGLTRADKPTTCEGPPKKSILKLVKLQSLVAKCCKMRKI